MLVNHTKKYIFIHIPKCGGTTVQETLLKHSIFSGEEFTMYEFHTSLLCDVAQGYIDQGYKAFTFVRDPYTRFASAWAQVQFMTDVYKGPDDIVNELKKKNYLLILSPSFFFTGPMKDVTRVYKLEQFKKGILDVLDTYGYPRVWWNRNERHVMEKDKKVEPKEFYSARPDFLKFVTEFYFRDFVELGYPMKMMATPFPHELPYFESKFKYDWKDVRDHPEDIYYWAMKSVHDQEGEPLVFQGASGPEPPQ
jgi:hypothetical protein